MIDPDPAAVVTPAISKPARRLADLARNPNTAADVDSTVLTRAEIGRALETSNISGIRISNEGSAMSLKLEISAAAMIDPDALPVVAPTISLAARRAAPLAQKRRCSLNVALAVVPATIFRGAGELHCFVVATAVPITVVVVSSKIVVMVSIMTMKIVAIVIAGTVHLTGVNDEVRTTAMIDPHALLIESPA